MKKILFLLITLFLFSTTFAQTSNKITYPCPGTSTRAAISFTRSGDINIVPCPTRNLLFNGGALNTGGLTNLNGLNANPQTLALAANDTASWNSAVSTHTLNLPITSVTGTSRSAFVPMFSGSNGLGKSELRYTSGAFDFFPSGSFRLNMDSSGRVVSFGDLTNLDNYFQLNDSANTATFNAESVFINANSGVFKALGTLSLGDVNNDADGTKLLIDNTTRTITAEAINFIAGDVNATANRTIFTIDDATGRFKLQSNHSAPIFDLSVSAFSILLHRTITPTGTTGAQTINKTAGTANIAAGSSTVTITNSLVTPDTIIAPSLRTNDTNCTGIKNVQSNAGSLTIRLNAACAAEVSVGFVITN